MVKNKLNIKIGVDLDNTLINYDEVFLLGANELGLIPLGWHGDKIQIKKYLHSKDDGATKWQTLQGRVYGKLIEYAKLFDGAYRFLWRCCEREIIVDLVSHKTEYGHNDFDEIPLRKVAINFLISHNILVGKGYFLRNIYFEDTLQNKVLRIIENRYDYFIDDLPEVLGDSKLPKSLKRILIGNNEYYPAKNIENLFSWRDIESRVLGKWTESELISLAKVITSKNVIKANWMEGGGNSSILKVLLESGEKFILKFYSNNDSHNRLNSEFHSFKLIRENFLDNVPLAFQKDLNFNVGMYEWIEGSEVKNINAKHIQQALEFLKSLNELSKLPSFQNFQNASAAFLSGHEFEEQLHLRFNVLNKSASSYPKMYDYLHNELLPIMKSFIFWVNSEWRIDLLYNERLPRFSQTLSPSDFGFHNAIKQINGKLVFIDFEYFGWDDPVKLIADFCFHPGMKISSKLKKQWISGALKIDGEEILERLRLAWPLIGLSWCLILLNEYRDDIWSRRCIANQNKSHRREKILVTQLNRSRRLLNRINKTYTQPLLDFI